MLWIALAFTAFLRPGASASITTCAEAQTLLAGNLTGSFVVANNLDCSGVAWVPIGRSTPFSGSLDGAYHTISNLSINYSIGPSGFFSLLAGTVSNLEFASVTVVGASFVGVLAGRVLPGGFVSNVAVTNVSVLGTDRTGCIAGSINVGQFSIAITQSDVFRSSVRSSASYAGGVVGELLNGTISSVAAKNVQAQSPTQTGGLVGYIAANGRLERSSALDCSVSSGDQGGGAVGVVEGEAWAVAVGGSVVCTVGTCGGFVGRSSGNITDCISFASVSVTSAPIGGFVGSDSGSLTVFRRCIALGLLNSTTAQLHGFLGMSSGAFMTDCYFDRTLTGATSDGSTATNYDSLQFRNPANFVTFDMVNVWQMSPRPVLRKPLVRYPTIDIFDQCDQLALIGDSLIPEYMTLSITLFSDLDCSSSFWTPIGSASVPFSGTFDGQGNTIRNLNIQPFSDYVGLFGLTVSATLRHLRLERVSVVGNNFVGALVGRANSTAISDVMVFGGSVDGLSAVGGMAGAISGGSQMLLRVLGVDVSGTSDVGGVVGLCTSVRSLLYLVGRSSRVEATGAGAAAGGLIGRFVSSSLSLCLSDNDVRAPAAAGGLIGSMTQSAVKSSYSLGYAVSSALSSASGGLVGSASLASNITSCFASPAGLVSPGAIGGLVGANQDGTLAVADSFWLDQIAPTTAGNKGTAVPLESLKNRTLFLATFGLSWANNSDWHFSPPELAWYPVLSSLEEYLPTTPLARCADLELICRNEFSRRARWSLGSNLNCSSPTSGLSDAGLSPLCGDAGPPFEGEFDGSGWTIAELSIATFSGVNMTALFSRIAGPAHVHDLVLSTLAIYASVEAAGLAVSVEAGAVVENVLITDSLFLSNGGSVAGLALHVEGAVLHNCSVAHSSLMTLGPAILASGLVGSLDAHAVVRSCNIIDVSIILEQPSTGAVAGLVGRCTDSELSNSYVSSSSIEVMISAAGPFGGAVGSLHRSSLVSQVFVEDSFFNASTVASNSGSFVGFLENGTVADCFCVAELSAGTLASGGFAGLLLSGSISRVYSAVSFSVDIAPTSSLGVGVFLGKIIGAGTVQASFADSSLPLASAPLLGYQSVGSPPAVQALASLQMYTAAPYLSAAWNMTAVWSINEGLAYPRLRMGVQVARNDTPAQTIVERVSAMINSTLAAESAPAARFSLVEQLLQLLDTDVNNDRDMPARQALRNCLLDTLHATTNASLSVLAPLLQTQVRIVTGAANQRPGEIGPETAEALCGLVSQAATAVSLLPSFGPDEASLIINSRAAVQSAQIAVASLPRRTASAGCLSAGTARARTLPCLSLERVIVSVSTALPPSSNQTTISVGDITIVIVQTNGSSGATVGVGAGVNVVVPPGGESGVVTVIVYPPSQNPNVVANGTQTVNLGTVVVSVTITTLNGTVVQPPGGVTITIPPAPGLVEQKCTTPTCSYFDESAGVWRSGGLTTSIIRDSSGQITSYECNTPHLTDFAVLLLAESGCESVFEKYKDMFFAFAVLFGVFFAVAAVQACRAAIVSSNDRSRSRVAGFYRVAMLLLAACGLFCRLVYTAMAASGGLEGASVASLVVLLSLPYYFLFLAFVTVIGQWIAMVGIANSMTSINMGIGLAVAAVSVVLAAMWGVAATASTTAKQADAAAQGSYVIGALCLLLSFGFVVAGGRILFQSAHFASRSEKQRAIERKLYYVICAYSASFSAEAALWVYSIVALDSFSAHFLEFYVAFLLVELFTYATMLHATSKFATANPHASQTPKGLIFFLCCLTTRAESQGRSKAGTEMTVMSTAARQ